MSAAFPGDLDRGAALGGVDGHDDSADQRAQRFLAIAIGRRLGLPEARKIASEASERVAFVVG